MNFVEQFLSTNDSPAKVATAATMVAAVGTMAYFTFLGFGGSKSELAPALTEEETTKIMNSMVDKMRLAAPKLIMAAENIKKQIQAQGQDIDDPTLLKMFLLPQFEQFISDTQDGACDEFDIDEDELEEAVTYYTKRGHEELILINKNIINLYKQFGGVVAEEEDAAVAENGADLAEFTLDKVIALLNVLTQKMMEVTERYTAAFIEDNGRPSSHADLEQFQLGLMYETQEAEKAAVEAFGLSTSTFQALIMKFQSSVEVQQVFMNMQVENAQLFAKYNIKMM